VLQGRLIPIAATAALLATLTACASADGSDRGVIRENVIEPGITALDDSKALACSTDLTTVQTALESYELLKREPAPDEAALVDAGFLREPSDYWDVVDGKPVPADPVCGDVAPAPTTTVEIVTSTEPEGAATADELYAGYSPEQIDAVGGPDCARQLAVIFAGVDRYLAEQGQDPGTLADLESAGYLSEPVTLWAVVDDTLVPADGSPCIDYSG
jgi:hypothetical protein